MKFEEALRHRRDGRGMRGRGVDEEGGGNDEQEDSDRPRVESVLLEQRRAEENRVEQDRRGTEESPGARVPRIRDELDREQEYSDGPEGDPERVRNPPRANVRDPRDEEEPGAHREPDRREGVHVGARGRRYFKRSSRGYHQRASPSRAITHSWSPVSKSSARQRPIA